MFVIVFLVFTCFIRSWHIYVLLLWHDQAGFQIYITHKSIAYKQKQHSLGSSKPNKNFISKRTSPIKSKLENVPSRVFFRFSLCFFYGVIHFVVINYLIELPISGEPTIRLGKLLSTLYRYRPATHTVFVPTVLSSVKYIKFTTTLYY